MIWLYDGVARLYVGFNLFVYIHVKHMSEQWNLIEH